MLFFKVTVPFHASANSYCPAVLLFGGQTPTCQVSISLFYVHLSTIRLRQVDKKKPFPE